MTTKLYVIGLRLITIVVGVFVIVWLEEGVFQPSVQARTQSPLSVTPATVGSRPPGVEGIGLADVATIALVLHAKGCAACQDNWPAYKRIIGTCGNHMPRTKVVVLSLEPPDDMGATLKAEGLKPDDVLSFPTMHKIEVNQVPALIVFDKSGTITKSFDGPVTPEQEHKIVGLCSAGR